MNLMVFTIVCLKTSKFYRIWSLFGQLNKTFSKFCSCKIVLKHFFKKNYENRKLKKIESGAFSMVGRGC